MASLLQRISRRLRLAETGVEDESQPKQITLHVKSTGSSGVENYAGYYSEEYLQSLRGTRAADIWDKMRRSDPQIRMVLSAVKNVIKSGHWTVQPGDDSAEAQQDADLIEQILFRDNALPWLEQLSEILTMIDFGFSVFEITHKVVMNDPKFGNYNSVAKIGWRSPRTIERWNLDKETGKLISVRQQAFGDLQRLVDIPAEFLLVFTHEKEGDNYEGVSALRPCYGPWARKDLYLKLMAIGIEKFAVPTPYMEIPEGKEDSEEFDRAKTILEQYTSHEKSYITYPAGFKLGFSDSKFDAEKVRTAIDKEDMQISRAFMTNFLELGQTGSGSYALSNDLSDFFLGGIEHIAINICDTLNRGFITEMVKMNRGARQVYPKLTVSGIKDKPGKELADIVKVLADGKIIVPDADLEKDFRERYGLTVKMAGAPTPEQVMVQEAQKAQQQALAPVASPPTAQLSEVITLAEQPKTPKALITEQVDVLRALMTEQLGLIGKDVVNQLMKQKKASNPSQYLNIVNKVNVRGTSQYSASLKDALATASTKAINQARKEIPGGRDVKLTEDILSGVVKLSEFDNLPKSVQKAINAQVGLLSVFQIQDLLKALFFQFNNSVESTDSDSTLEGDLLDSVSKYVEGGAVATAAGNTVSKAVNESRSAFFFEPDVLEKIESFTFVNGDPVSPICQDLAGTVFDKDDPNMERYSPPLHHNCKSYLVANLVGSGKEIDEDGLKPSKASLDKFITLAEGDGMLVVQAIDVDKKAALSMEDARRIAMNWYPDPRNAQESEFVYRFQIIDSALLKDGTLNSFSPAHGVTIWVGVQKPLA